MTTTIPDTMRASVLVAPQTLELMRRPVPHPARDEVLVRITAVGVCGSDVHFYRDGRLGDWVADRPLVLGHEAGGTIVAVGADVTPDRVGRRVSIEPQRPNPTSSAVLRGQYHLDPDMQFFAIPGRDGAFQEYATIQSHFAFDVPDAVSDDAAGLMEPLSVAIATARKAGVTLGSRVLIAGAGPIGVVICQVARASGAAQIVVTDPAAERRQRALGLGATDALDPGAVDVTGLEVDAFIDASGAVAAIQQGIAAVGPAGRVVLVGMGPSEVPLPLPAIQRRELTVTGVFRYANTWPTAIDLVARGEVDLDAMVTGHFGLARVADAMDSTADAATVKSVVVPYV